VRYGFEALGLLDAGVQFHKGFFEHSLPRARPLLQTRRIAVLRMDGDMYESTTDILYNTYEYVSVGGAVIIDDFNIPFCRAAVQDFFVKHGQALPDIKEAGDGMAAYFFKPKDFPVRQDLYDSFNEERARGREARGQGLPVSAGGASGGGGGGLVSARAHSRRARRQDRAVREAGAVN
jgi:hypothetical protein